MDKSTTNLDIKRRLEMWCIQCRMNGRYQVSMVYDEKEKEYVCTECGYTHK